MPRKQKWNEWEPGKLKFSCAACNADIWRYESDAKGTRKFCNQKCYSGKSYFPRINEENYKEYIENYYLKHVDKDPDYKGPNGDCWGWLGRSGDGKYGKIWSSYLNSSVLAHRFSWEYHNKASIISKDIFVCHHCDNPPCTNPDHLFLGSSRDNAHDMLRKNRSFGQLLCADVWLIRWGFETNTIEDFALMFSATIPCIRKIKNGSTRLDVKKEDFDWKTAYWSSSLHSKNNNRRRPNRDLTRYSFYKEPVKSTELKNLDDMFYLSDP